MRLIRQTSPIRARPSAALVELLLENRYKVAVYDPLAVGFDFPLAASLAEALRGAEGVVLMVDHAAFDAISPSDLARSMRGRLLIDTRNFFDRAASAAAGLRQYTIGTPRPS